MFRVLTNRNGRWIRAVPKGDLKKLTIGQQEQASFSLASFSPAHDAKCFNLIGPRREYTMKYPNAIVAFSNVLPFEDGKCDLARWMPENFKADFEAIDSEIEVCKRRMAALQKTEEYLCKMAAEAGQPVTISEAKKQF